MPMPEQFRVAMIDYDYSSLEPIESELRKVGARLEAQHSRDINDAIQFARDADGVIIQALGPVDETFIGALTRCRVLCRCGIGLDQIDVACATKHGIAVTHVPSYCEDEVSDHAMALLLSCVRKTVTYANSVRRGEWDWKVGRPVFRLRGRVLGLAGFGKIPRTLTPKAKGFGLEVIAFDPYISPETAAEAGVELVSFHELLARSDFISVHAPLVDQTRGMFGMAEFKKMKETAFIINTARGPIINNTELAEALRSGDIAGAGLDVLDEEPAAVDDPLRNMPNVVVTPHAAYYSEQSLHDLLTLIGRHTAQVLGGKRPDALANPEVAAGLGLR